MSVNITVSEPRRGARTGKRPASHSMPATGSIRASIVQSHPALRPPGGANLEYTRHAAAAVDPDALPADAGPSPERREELRAMKRAVEALPPRQRAALMLRQFQGLGYAEIAASLGGNEVAARANVYQALKKLRAALGRGIR